MTDLCCSSRSWSAPVHRQSQSQSTKSTASSTQMHTFALMRLNVMAMPQKMEFVFSFPKRNVEGSWMFIGWLVLEEEEEELIKCYQLFIKESKFLLNRAYRCTAGMYLKFLVPHCRRESIVSRNRGDSNLKPKISSRILFVGAQPKLTAPHASSGLINCPRKLHCHFD